MGPLERSPMTVYMAQPSDDPPPMQRQISRQSSYAKLSNSASGKFWKYLNPILFWPFPILKIILTPRLSWNLDFKNGCINEFEDNKEKSCSRFKNRVSLKIDFWANWTHESNPTAWELKNFFKPLRLSFVCYYFKAEYTCVIGR